MYQLVNKTYIDMTILPISVAILILTVGHILLPICLSYQYTDISSDTNSDINISASLLQSEFTLWVSSSDFHPIPIRYTWSYSPHRCSSIGDYTV